VDCVLDVQFKPKFEFISSLHSYICRKSHRKIDLSPHWAEEVRSGLTPELAEMLNDLEINADWKLAYLLVVLSEHAETPADLIGWLEGLSTGDLYERFAPYSSQFPEHMGQFQSQMIKVFTEWNRQYFEKCSPAVLEALETHVAERTAAYKAKRPEEFVDETTGGFVFDSTVGVSTMLLVPQYHFQPVNVIYQFGSVLFCHYASRIDLSGEDFMSAHDYRVIRSLAEKSRLKILRYLQEGPKSFSEIVRELKLSKGITHDHISKLRSAGLIHAHFQGENLTGYSTRLKALETMQDRLIDYIGHR
jgi:DNA-binding transcriptional ArsR family regulator